METGPWFKVLSERMENWEMDLVILGLVVQCVWVVNNTLDYQTNDHKIQLR